MKLFLLFCCTFISIMCNGQRLVLEPCTIDLRSDSFLYDMNKDGDISNDVHSEIESSIHIELSPYVRMLGIVFTIHPKSGNDIEFRKFYYDILFYVSSESGIDSYILVDKVNSPMFGLIGNKDKKYMFILNDFSLIE